MTFRDKITERLSTEHPTLSSEKVAEIVSVYENSQHGKPMKGRLDDEMQGYGPDGTGNILLSGMLYGVGRALLACTTESAV